MSIELGRKLKELREATGKTLQEVANELSRMASDSSKPKYKSPSIIHEWEKGLKEPRASARKYLAQIYGVSESELFCYSDTDENMVMSDKIQCSSISRLSSKELFNESDDKSAVVFNNCAEKVIWDDSLCPLVQKGQKIIYSLNDIKPRENDLVLVRLKDEREFARRYSAASDGRLAFKSINDSQTPITTSRDDVVYCYKIVGIKL